MDIMAMMVQAQNDPALLQKLAASDINPNELLAKLRAAGMASMQRPNPLAGAPSGAPVPAMPEMGPPQGGIGTLLPEA